MRGGRDFAVNVSDFSFRVDHVRDPLRGGSCRTIARSVFHADIAGGVAKQWKGKPVFFGKGGVRLHGIETDAENLRIFLLEILDSVTEPGPFGRSPGRVCLRIKPQNDRLSTKI